MMDVFAADGPSIYETAETDPDLLVARIPESERRFMADIPIATTGGRQDEKMEAIRSAVNAADVRRIAQQSERTSPRSG